jgi:hypothetical protein
MQALAVVVRKGFNFESILCGLSPRVFGIGPLVRRLYLLNPQQFIGCVVPISE